MGPREGGGVIVSAFCEFEAGEWLDRFPCKSSLGLLCGKGWPQGPSGALGVRPPQEGPPESGIVWELPHPGPGRLKGSLRTSIG